MSNRTMPALDAMRLRILQESRDKLIAQAECLRMRARESDAGIGAIMRAHDLDPTRHGVITAEDGKLPLGTVVDSQTGEAVADLAIVPAP